MTSNQSNEKEDRVSEEPKKQKPQNTPIEETKQETSNILENSGFNKIISKIKRYTDFYNIYEDLGDTQIKTFFNYIFNSKDIDIGIKRNSLFFIFSDYYAEENLKKIFNKEDYNKFGVLSLKILRDSDGNKIYISEYIKENLKEIVNNYISTEIIPWWFIKKLREEQIECFLFEKKHIKSFINMFSEKPRTFSFPSKLQKKIIDHIIENYKEITKHYNTNSNLIKEDIEDTLYKLIIDNSDYFFEKLISLDDLSFKEITQTHYIYPILKYFSRKALDNSSHGYDYEEYISTKDSENELYKRFFKRLVDVVGLDNLNKYREFSYYDFIFDYNEDYIEDIDIERIFDGTSKINKEPSPESNSGYELTNVLTNKLIQSKDWLSKCIKMEKLGVLENIIILPDVYEEVFTNFSEEDIINYLILLEKKGYISRINFFKEDFFVDLNQRIINKKDNKKLIKIFSNENILEFISKYKERFNNFDDIFKSKTITMLLSLNTEVLENINFFIDMARKTPNINFELNLEDINQDFIRFIKRTFFPYSKGRDNELQSHTITSYLSPELFDEKIKDYNYFSIKDQKSVKVETGILHSGSYLPSNLMEICNIYGVYGISGLKRIEKGYNDYLKTDENNPKYLYNFLKDENIGKNIKFFTEYFKEFHNKKLEINELLNILETTSKEEKTYEFSLIKTFKILEKNIDNFNPREFIKIGDDRTVSIKEFPENFHNMFGGNQNLKFITSVFSNLNTTKLIEFNKYYKQIFKIREGYCNINNNIGRIIGQYKDLEHADEDMLSKSWFKTNRLVIQKAIDLGDFSKVGEHIKFIRILYERDNLDSNGYDKLNKLLSNLINETGGYLDSTLLGRFVTSNIINNFNSREWSPKKSLDYVYNLTGINLKDKRFQLNETSCFILKIIDNKEKYEKLFGEINKKELKKLLSYNINLTSFYNGIESIIKNKGGVLYGYFLEAISHGNKLDQSFPINTDNFTKFIPDNQPIITLEKDAGFSPKGTTPWTKTWFLEKPERKNYLNPKTIATFKKFGTIVGLGIVEGSQSSDLLSDFYKHIFNNISPEKSRNSVLQLGEVFNVLLKKESYKVLDNLLKGEVKIGQKFKEFIEKYEISDKGRTILTLMITREINLSFSVFKDKKGKQQVDVDSVKKMLLSVYNKLEKYKKVIEKFDNVPVKTSIGVEIEITRSIAKGYKEITGNDYKTDIETLSAYSGISQGADAVHEIATKPTDNPYLLLLELKLLEDLDFLDLNFKKEDYSKGSRGLHITIGGENGINLDENANFIQNILIAANLGGVNVGKDIKEINRYGNIKLKEGYEVDDLFDNFNNDCVEYRSISIDKAEPFERSILAIFVLNMVKQIYQDFFILEGDNIKNFEEFKKALEENNNITKNEKILRLVYKFSEFKKNIEKIVNNHNENFEKNETIKSNNNIGLEKLLTLSLSNSPVISIMKEIGVNIDYFKNLQDLKIETQEDFIKKLEKDNKDTKILSERQSKILYKTYKKKIEPGLKELKKENSNVYKNLEKYLEGDLENVMRKLTNKKRFKSVINGDKGYLENIKFSSEDLYYIITPELINKFTRINNLFIKKDSVNALSTLDTTVELNGEKISDSKLTETTVFDKMELGLEERKGYNLIQGASENMITQAIQREILNFTYSVIDELKR